MLGDDYPILRFKTIADITTPRIYQFDLKINRSFSLGSSPLTAYLYIQNLLNRKNVQHVYWRTGTAEEDGSRELLTGDQLEGYFELYELINIGHRQEFTWEQGGDLFGKPREIRFGLQIEL